MSVNFVIKELDDSGHAAWDAYVERCPTATFFHRAGWRTVIEKGLGHKAYFLYAERDGEICGVLPLGNIKSLMFGNALTSTPYMVYGGVAANDRDAANALVEAGKSLSESLNVDYMELRHIDPQSDDLLRKDGMYVTFRKSIDPDIEQNMLNIPRKQRAMVRKGIKAGLVSKIDSDIDRFYDAYCYSYQQLGTPVQGKDYFLILRDVFGNDCEIMTVTIEDQPVASVMSFYFRDQVLPFYAGSQVLAREYKAHDFMYWELMRRACERGLKVFDYGRSKMNTGSYSFKKNWGFEPEPLHYEYYLVKAKELPNVSPTNPKYQLFIKAWQRLPIAVTKMVGPWLAKNLP